MKRLKNELVREYYSEYLKIKRIIKEGSKPGKARKEAFENIYDLYFDAQKENLPVSEIHEGTAEEFAAEILKSLPGRGVLKRWHFALIAAAVLLAFEAVLYFTSDFYLENKMGFAHALNNPDRYSFQGYETISVFQREGSGRKYELSLSEGEYEILEGEDSFNKKEFEEFVFSEDGERIKLLLKVPFSSRNPHLKTLDLPVNLWADGFLGDVNTVRADHGHIKLIAGESLYYGYLDYHRTEKNGDIYLGFDFIRQKGEGAEEYIRSGESFTVDFGRIYRMYWCRRLQGFDSSSNRIRNKIVHVLEHINLQPFFRFAEEQTVDYPKTTISEVEVTKTSESGRFTVTAHLKVDFEADKILRMGYVDENNFEDTAEFEVDEKGFGVIEGGKKAFIEIKYRIEGREEWQTERIEYTFDDME